MRVRISYSVGLDEVPSETTRMLNETLGQLQDTLDNIRGLMQKIESEDLNKQELSLKIDASRKTLGAVDARLADVTMILSGFYDAKEQMAMVPPEEEGEDESLDFNQFNNGDVEVQDAE